MKRTFREIAIEVQRVWKNVYFGAKPYLEAMMHLETTDPEAPYYFETAGDIVRYFLANATTFRGENARRIKAELKSMI